MRTMACPVCSEIIPDDVDYCPFCGESTRQQSAESLMTDDDRAVAERMANIAAANTSAPPSDPALKLPPAAGQHLCMMCHREPPTMGDYCLECHEKLELGPEQWEILKQDMSRRNTLMLLAAVIAVLAIALAIVHSLHHGHQTASAHSLLWRALTNTACTGLAG